MANYIFSHQGKQYAPDGIVVEGVDTTEHNARLERMELAAWALQPDRYAGYVDFPDATTNAIRLGYRVLLSTWTGEVLGHGEVTGVFRNNLTGSRTVSIRVRGTNGATYIGRFGDEWSQFCRIRKTR